MADDDDLKRLYRDIVLDHSRNPRNFRSLEAASHEATGHNPLCGDEVTIWLKMSGSGRIEDASARATGCAISLASASMLTEMVQGKDAGDARALISDVDAMLAGAPASERLGAMAALAGVQAYPSRIRCAALAWRALAFALGAGEPVVVERGH